MWLTVPADSEQQAMDEAANRYQRVRQAAHFPAEPARIIGVFGPPVGAPRDDQLMTEASNLLEAGHPEMAVVAMQTACELLAKTFSKRWRPAPECLRRRCGRLSLFRITRLARSSSRDRRAHRTAALVAGLRGSLGAP
jgi:hypothetical protein